MRWTLAIVLFVHGMTHLIAFAKAFGFVELTALSQQIPPPMGLLWLAAAILLVCSAVLLAGSCPGWWGSLAIAALVSQVAILSSWRDAKYGTAVNALALAAALVGAASS